MVVASDVVPLMHALLTGAGFKKTASVLVKEAKLELKVCTTEHDLLDVYEFYLTHKVRNEMQRPKTLVGDTSWKSRQTTRKSKCSSRVESHEIKRATSGSSEEENQVNKSKTRGGKKKKESSSSESEDEAATATKKRGKKTAVAQKKASSSSEESSDEEAHKSTNKTVHANKNKGEAATKDISKSSKKRKNKAPVAEKNTKKAKREADSSSDDSSSQAKDSSDSDSDSDSSESDSDSDTLDHEEGQKKEAVRRQEAAKAALEWQPKKIEKVDTKVKSAGTPFQRVDGEFWSQKILDDTLRDNSYEGTFGIDGVGVKANNKLMKTRGKDFTKGKNKLKRSTYMCGAISMASNSFKFED